MKLFVAEPILKPNSWTYNLAEVSGHNLESSQTWGSVWISGFLKPWGRGYGFLSGFPPFSCTVNSNCTLKTVRGCVSLKKYKSHGIVAEVTVNNKEEKSEDFCLDFVQEFGVWKMCAACKLPMVDFNPGKLLLQFLVFQNRHKSRD